MNAAKHLAVVFLVVAGCAPSEPPGATQPPAETRGGHGLAQGRLRTGPVAIVGEPATRPPPVLDAPAGSLAPARTPRSRALRAGCTSESLAMKVLVLSADGSESQLQAIKDALDYHSIPYTVWIASQKPGQLTADQLATGCAGNYQGVVLAYGDLLVGSVSALTASEWAVLHAYEADFGVREVEWFGFPYGLEGFGAATGANPVVGTLTAAATAAGGAFSYMKAGASVTINQWTVLALPTDPAIVPLLVDGSGSALVSTRVTADGRETMKVTFSSNFADLHGLVLAHGYIEWLTKGIYLGQYRAYLTPQVDDYFIPDDIYPVLNADFCGDPGFPACVCGEPTQPICVTYRMDVADLNAVVAWQNAVRSGAGNTGFRLAMAFNGLGAVLGGPVPDPLTEATKTAQGNFLWINHTYDHLNLGKTIGRTDVVPPPDTTAALTANTFTLNETIATRLGLASYRSSRIVTPDVSGLSNPEALLALGQVGVRYAITDASIPAWDNPTPNVGMHSAFQRNIYLVPRRATNLFYDVSTPTEWKGQYDALYNKPVNQGGVGGPSTFAEIVDRESGNLLVYVLRGDIAPHMYHQANLRAYPGGGGKTLIGDLLDATLAKFRAYSTLPIQSVDLDVIAERMKATGERNAAGLTGTLVPGVSVTLTSPRASRAALSRDLAASACTTAGGEPYTTTKCISNVSVPAGGTVTIPLP